MRMAKKDTRQGQQKRTRKRQERKRKKRPGSKLNLESQRTSVSRTELSVRDEIRYIVARAQEHDARIVGVGGLVLFSTETGDAWALDPEDGLAACLAQGGTPQELALLETESQFAIDWPAQFVIDGDAFSVLEHSGRLRTIIGYPARAIAAHCEQIAAAPGR
jgi:hypothetical protein